MSTGKSRESNKVTINRDDVVIVVPVYKEQLSAMEHLSLQQLYKVLDRYDICFMAPERMRAFLERKRVQYKCFPDNCLSSRSEYSELLLTAEFYEHFAMYKYMLLYQLDAFVFYDKLLDFCSLGYDYIGAPMDINWKKEIGGRVGNGGLSLRNIKSCQDLLLEKDIVDNVFSKLSVLSTGIRLEDKFFGYCGVHNIAEFKIPEISVALKFAVEFNVGHCYQKMTRENLPFGCHAWSKENYIQFWRPFIESYGYIVPKLSSEKSFYEWRIFVLNRYIASRLAKYKPLKAKEILHKLIPVNKQCTIWGVGDIGKRTMELLQCFGVKVTACCDSNARVIKFEGLPVHRIKAFAGREDVFFIVASTKYEQEIVKQLENTGWQKGTGYITYLGLLQEMFRAVMRSKYLLNELGEEA